MAPMLLPQPVTKNAKINSKTVILIVAVILRRGYPDSAGDCRRK